MMIIYHNMKIYIFFIFASSILRIVQNDHFVFSSPLRIYLLSDYILISIQIEYDLFIYLEFSDPIIFSLRYFVFMKIHR